MQFVRAQTLHSIQLNGSETFAHIIDRLTGLLDLICLLFKHILTLRRDWLVMIRSSLCWVPLQDETLICLSGVEELGTLDVSSTLLGGKVHGPLSRAGKVRGQTPKVDKLEKKKKKTGTAKRRIQYNRRFVNVVPTFGKKQGPNANS